MGLAVILEMRDLIRASMTSQKRINPRRADWGVSSMGLSKHYDEGEKGCTVKVVTTQARLGNDV